MAIVKIGVISDPAAAGDYTRLMAHVSAYARQVNGNQFILTQTAGTGLPALALGAYLQHGGVVYQVQTADEVIAGTPADGTYYIKVAASSEVLVATWLTDISGYSWNAVYNCLLAADESQLLPYMVVVSGSATVYTKYRLESFGQKITGRLNVDGNSWFNGTLNVADAMGIGGALAVTGAIAGATVNTGYGNNEVYKNEVVDYDITVDGGTTVTTTISDMEIRQTVNLNLKLVMGATATFNFKVPASGTYLVSFVSRSATSAVPTYVTSGGTAYIGVANGGDSIYSISSGGSNFYAIVVGSVRRLT